MLISNNIKKYLSILVGLITLVLVVILIKGIKYKNGVVVSDCNQNGTTTSCADLEAMRNRPTIIVPHVAKLATSTISNFSFNYDSSISSVADFGWEGSVSKGNLNIGIYTPTGSVNVFIFTQSGAMISLNPDAKKLDDYAKDYSLNTPESHEVPVNGVPTDVSNSYEVHILSSNKVTINGITMLKQHYNVGYKSLDEKGNETFVTSTDYGVGDLLRYVFFDEKNFAAVTGWQADVYIEQIVSSIHLLK